MKWLIERLTFWRVVSALILLLGVYATIIRFFVGLGSSTYMNDAVPWGMWIGFDVMVGVGLAAGGFSVAGAVHVFRLHKYEPVARPAVLTAFLGYILVAVGLLYDLGKPWNIWHPIINWNPHSVMFEVAWCVMIYLSVLALEFSPVVLERFGLKTPLRFINNAYIVLVIMGICLSMMHQSSLGTLFLIAPDKVHPLWYTPFLPVLFFISAAAAGLSMTIVESYLSHRAFGKELEDHLLQGLGKAVVPVLSVYFIIRAGDLAYRGNLRFAFEATEEAVMWWGEIGLGVILPIVLMSMSRVRSSRTFLFFTAVLAVMGFILNRLNVATTSLARSTGVSYFPHWMELTISAMLVVVGMILFAMAVKYLNLFPKEELKPEPIAVRPIPTASGYGVAALWGLAAFGVILVTGVTSLEAKQNVRTTDVARTEKPPPVQPPVVSMPMPYRFERHLMSPGRVTFRHWQHVDLKNPSGSCARCHQGMFSIREPGKPLMGALVHKVMDAGQLCGACHDDKTAFTIKDNCERCH